MTEHDMIAGTKRGLAHCFEALLADCHSLMARYARRWSNVLAYEDGMQFARLSVWRAAMRFDPERGASFAGYAQQRIRADLRRRAEDWGSDLDDKTPGPKGSGLRLAGVVRAIRYDHSADEDDNAGPDLYATTAARQEGALLAAQIRAAVTTAVARLPAQQRAVMEARLDGAETFGEVAEAVGLGGKARAEQVEKLARLALWRAPELRAIARELGINTSAAPKRIAKAKPAPQLEAA